MTISIFIMFSLYCNNALFLWHCCSHTNNIQCFFNKEHICLYGEGKQYYITYPYSVLTFNKPAHSERTLPNDTNNIMILGVEAHLKEEMRTKTISSWTKSLAVIGWNWLSAHPYLGHTSRRVRNCFSCGDYFPLLPKEIH